MRINHHYWLVLLFLLSPTTVISAGNTPALSRDTYKILSESHELMEKGNNNKAAIKLEKLLKDQKIKDYDKAVISQTLGYIYNASADNKSSIEAFKKALAYNALPEDVTHQLHYLLAQLLISTESYKEGLGYLGKWFLHENSPGPDAHILAATAYYYLKDYKQMIPHAEKALFKSTSPPLMWYELLLAGYYEIKAYKKTIPLLLRMIEKSPKKKNLWMQLVNSYQLTKNESKALATFELAYKKGLLSPEEIVQLAKNYLFMEMPYQAGKLLQAEIENNNVEATVENLELLANCWMLSQEYDKAETILVTLTQLSDIAAYPRLAQLYVDREDWEKTYKLLEPLVNEADKKYDAKIYLYYGIAAFHLKNYHASQLALEKALSDTQTNELAKWWLNRINKMDS